MRCVLVWLLSCLSVLGLSGCASNWQIEVIDSQGAHIAQRADWNIWRRTFAGDVQDRTAIRLERVLAETSGRPLMAVEMAGERYDWHEIRADSWLSQEGQICVLGNCDAVSTIHIVELTDAPMSIFGVMGLAPTIAGALQAPSPEKTSARALGAYAADQVLLVFVDGLSYERALAARGEEITPFLDTLGLPQIMLTTYPSQGLVPLAAALSGAAPYNNGVMDSSCIELQAETLLDVLDETGQGALLIETHAVALDVSAHQFVHLEAEEGQAVDLVADAMKQRATALVVLRLASLDRDARTYGLQSDEYAASLNRVDQELARLVIGLPSQVLVLVTSGYGMHAVQGSEYQSESGSLLPEDMLVPLWAIQL